MAKTLIIKGADFSNNKLDTISFGETPCEGISIPSAETIYGIESAITLTPTLTPENTTDVVIWATSNNDVASVSGGVVTSHRFGTATITATCGDYSATCTITVEIPFVDVLASHVHIGTLGPHSLADAVVGEYGNVNREIALGSERQLNMYPVSCAYETGGIADIYPIPIPTGAKTINFALQNFSCLVTFMNGNVLSTLPTTLRVRDSAKVLDGETASGGTDWSITSWVYDQRTIAIPEDEGINSFALSLRAKDDTAYNNYNISNLSITFGYE